MTKEQLINGYGTWFDVEPNTGCWLWLRSDDGHGYGYANYEDRSYKAHRLMFSIYRTPIPEGAVVCHKCDTPSCVNPDHLFIGTHADNVADKCMKGRQRAPIGQANGRAKLTNQDVRELLLASSSGYCQRRISKLFGVTPEQTSRIVTGKSRRRDA